MPVMDGLSATRALRALPRFEALPIIAATANAATADMERTRACRHERPHCQAAAGGAAVADAVALAGTFGERITGPSRCRACRYQPQPPPARPAHQRRSRCSCRAPVFDVALLRDWQESITTARLLPLIAQFVPGLRTARRTHHRSRPGPPMGSPAPPSA